MTTKIREFPQELRLFVYLHLLHTSMLGGDLSKARRWLRRVVACWWRLTPEACDILGVPLDRARPKGTRATRWWQRAALWYAARPGTQLADGKEVPAILGDPDAPKLNGLWVKEESRALKVLIPEEYSPCESILRLVDYHGGCWSGDAILKEALERRQLGFLVVLPTAEKKRRLRKHMERIGYFDLMPVRLEVSQ